MLGCGLLGGSLPRLTLWQWKKKILIRLEHVQIFKVILWSWVFICVFLWSEFQISLLIENKCLVLLRISMNIMWNSALQFPNEVSDFQFYAIIYLDFLIDRLATSLEIFINGRILVMVLASISSPIAEGQTWQKKYSLHESFKTGFILRCSNNSDYICNWRCQTLLKILFNLHLNTLKL